MNHHKQTLLMTVLGLGLVAAGCDDGGASGFAGEYCDLLAPCCKAAGRSANGQQCRALFSAFAGQSSFDQTKADACLAAMRAASKNDDFCSGSYDSSECSGVFESSGGTKKPGETCSDDDDCASSTEGEVECQTAFGTNSTVKKCQVQVKGREGDKPCSGTVDGNLTSYTFSSDQTDVPARAYLCNVADGLRCDEDAGCVKIATIGGMCTSEFERYACAKGARCDSTAKMCIARAAVGAACTNDQCVETAYCDDASKTCKAKRAMGQACESNDECTSSNCENDKCGSEGLADFGLALVCGD